MKRIAITLTMLFALILVSSCSNETYELIESSQDLKQATTAQDNTNIGTYKGVFTTLDSEFRGVVEIDIIDFSKSTLVESFHRATIELQTGETVFAISKDRIIAGQLENIISFSSKEISFNFSVNENGTNPLISEVVYNNTDADVLIKKHTTKNPVTALSGTYFCNGCGGSDLRTFNVIISNDGIGNQTYTTQMEFYGTSYAGIGIQDNCLDDGNLTFCDAESGDGVSNVGFSLANGDIVWKAEMSYSTSVDCSEITGIWNYRKGLSGEKSGTFRSDAATNCMTELTFEDFENAAINYTTSIPEFVGVSNKDYFFRVNYSQNIINNGVVFNEITGDYFFAAQDIDGDGATLPVQLTFENLNIASLNTIYFSAQFAEDDDGSNQDWDNSDYVHVDYSFDGGTTWITFFAIENDGSTFNSAPFIDTDLDGTGDGQEITDTFENFRVTFVNDGVTNPTASSTVSVRIAFDLNAGEEDIAIDNILIRGI